MGFVDTFQPDCPKQLRIENSYYKCSSRYLLCGIHCAVNFNFFFFISEMAESPGSIVRDGYLTSTSSPTSSGEDKLSGSDLGDTNGI